MQKPSPSTKYFLTLVIFILLITGTPSLSQSFNQETQDKVKKIVMMLNIAAKEFEEGVVDGKVVIAPEYEESQVFLQQASERFFRESAEIKNKDEAQALSHLFPELMKLIKAKVSSQKVWDKVNELNSQLMSTFAIELMKLPITPV